MHLIAKKMVFATAEPATSASPAGTAGDGHQQILTFDENQLLVSVFGVGNAHLSQVERVLDVRLSSSGNQLHMSGNPDDLDTCRSLFEALYAQAQRGEAVGPDDVDACLRFAGKHQVVAPDTAGERKAPPPQQPLISGFNGDTLAIKTRRSPVRPRSPGQAVYLDAMAKSEMVFGLGPAGTGKTYLSAAVAVSKLINEEVDRLILTRPAVEAGERLGFLPGDMKDKIDPYLRPLYDALREMLASNELARKMEQGVIEVAPLAFMRGRTLKRSFVILDEAQNTTEAQMKMFLTRLGEGSRMVINGDQSQTDLPRGTNSGLAHAVRVLSGVKGIEMVHMDENDVVRHPLVARIVKAYDQSQ